MEKIGIDVHKLATQVCILTGDGEFVEFRIRTEREALTKAFASRARARILLEAATESEWVARHLELLGHEVIVTLRSEHFNQTHLTHLHSYVVEHVRRPSALSGLAAVESRALDCAGLRSNPTLRRGQERPPRRARTEG